MKNKKLCLVDLDLENLKLTLALSSNQNMDDDRPKISVIEFLPTA